MNFYTNVLQWGNYLLVREIKNNQRQNFRIKYSPTLYSPAKQKTGYKTLEGKDVLPQNFNTMKEAKRWVDDRKDQPHLVYGNTQFAYNYLADTNKGRVDWDLKQILVVTIDIEVQCENGFPSAFFAKEELLSITIKNHQNKKIVVWGIGEFKTDRDDVTYIECKDEKLLLKEFLIFWEKHWPDVVTGWSSEFFDIPYLCNRIKKLFGEDELSGEEPSGEPEKETPSQSAKDISVKDLASGDFHEYDNDHNYLGSEDYDEDEAYEPPDLKGITNKTDPTILKQKYIDLNLHIDEKEREIEHYQDSDERSQEVDSTNQWRKAKNAQANIIDFLKQKSSGGGMMGALGHRDGQIYTSGRSGGGMYDSKNYGKNNKVVKESKYAFAEMFKKIDRR